jgi:predicted DNA-binding transcriptional regulator
MQAMALLGNMKVSTIAKKLGRSEGSVRRAIGDVWYQVKRSEGLSLADVARAFNVDKMTVYKWIDRGVLQAQIVRVETWKGYSISYDAVTSFLEEHGYALSNTVRPSDFIWKDIVGEIRQQLEKEYISSSGLASLLGYPKLDATRRKGFPVPSFRFGNRGGGDWFRRSDVAEWLNQNPGYMNQEARRELNCWK